MPTQAPEGGVPASPRPAGDGGGKRKNICDTQHDTERSSISTTSSATSSTNGHNWTSSSANKLSKFGRRIRDSCRNLKGRHCQNKTNGANSHNPEDYSTLQLPNESTRSKVYVAMDFSGRQEGRILDNPRDVKGCDKSASKDGYVPFRRRVAAPVADRLTETQATVHRSQAWFHINLTRDRANKILAPHTNTDGVFLVRESSVAGGFVISMTSANKIIHSQVLPVPTAESVVYSIDDGKTKFYDLLQLVEFYQLNHGSLPSRLKQFIVTGEHKTVDTSDNTDNTSENNDKDYEVSKTGGERAESPDSVKMTSSSETEADSAMSQDGASDAEENNREQQG